MDVIKLNIEKWKSQNCFIGASLKLNHMMPKWKPRRNKFMFKVHSLCSGKVAATPHLKIRSTAICAFYSLNYSLHARLQDNSHPKSPKKIEAKRKLLQFTVSGWLIMNGGENGSEKKLTSSNYIQYEVSIQLPAFVCMNHYFLRVLISS